MVEEIGPEHVVHIVTDNGSNYKKACKELLIEVYEATDEMGVRMRRPPFLHYFSSGMADNIGVDGPNLATLQD